MKIGYLVDFSEFIALNQWSLSFPNKNNTRSLIWWMKMKMKTGMMSLRELRMKRKWRAFIRLHPHPLIMSSSHHHPLFLHQSCNLAHVLPFDSVINELNTDYWEIFLLDLLNQLTIKFIHLKRSFQVITYWVVSY